MSSSSGTGYNCTSIGHGRVHLLVRGGGGGGGWGVGAVDIRGGGCSSESHVLCENEVECNILMFMTFFLIFCL